jgi:hypothetical protein
MTLCIQQATKDLSGMWEVETLVNNKKYTYELSDYDYQKALQFYRHGHLGRALNVLKGY